MRRSFDDGPRPDAEAVDRDHHGHVPVAEELLEVLGHMVQRSASMSQNTASRPLEGVEGGDVGEGRQDDAPEGLWPAARAAATTSSAPAPEEADITQALLTPR